MPDAPRQIPHGLGLQELVNASAQTLKLQGTGAELINWAPKSPKRALDLELRLQPIFPGFVAGVPIWRYSFEFGHGEATTFKQPGEAVGVLAEHVLPHRGLVARFTAREFRLNVRFAGFIGELPLPETPTQVQASIQPAISAARPSIVSEDQFVPGVLNPLRFPPEANEWRLRAIDGQPVAIGLNTVIQLAISGVPIAAPLDAALLFDWQPIPVLAAYWGTFGTEACTVQYR